MIFKDFILGQSFIDYFKQSNLNFVCVVRFDPLSGIPSSSHSKHQFDMLKLAIILVDSQVCDATPVQHCTKCQILFDEIVNKIG